MTPPLRGRAGQQRVGVTGSSGGLGQAVVTHLLRSGYAVVGADRVQPTSADPNFTAVRWDAPDVDTLSDALQGCDALVHLAAIPAPGAHPDEVVFTNNTAATFAALQAAVSTGISRAVIASSVSVYGMAFAPTLLPPIYVPVDEAHPLRNFDPYGLSKEVDEATARRFCRRYDMSVAALRFHWVADRDAQLGSRGARGEVDHESEIRNLWGYVDSDDAARACRLAIERAADRPYGFVALNVVAADPLADRPLRDLLAAHTPEVEVRVELGDTSGGWDISRAAEVIGWRPERSWRDPA